MAISQAEIASPASSKFATTESVGVPRNDEGVKTKTPAHTRYADRRLRHNALVFTRINNLKTLRSYSSL